MKKIAVLRCFKVSSKCSGSGCIKAFKNKTASFNDYEENSEMVMSIPCSGCSEDSLKEILNASKELKKQGVETIHLSTCIKIEMSLTTMNFLANFQKIFRLLDILMEVKSSKNP